MQVPVKYGRGEISVEFPPGAEVTVIRKPAMPTLADPHQATRAALAQPVGCQPLALMAQGAKTACIAICDITRPVPNHLFLRPLIESLVDGGVPRDGITVLVATGLHRPNLGGELAELVGDPWVLENVRIENHDARCDRDHVLLGTTATRDTVVRIDRRFVEADIRIATGLVEPHFMAGYSGGRKVIAPGLAHAETITTFHSARFMANPAAANCVLAENPLHEEQLQIVQMLGGALAVNTVIDEDRKLAMINFGEVVQSHQLAVEFVREYCELSIDRKFETVVTSAAGYPLDKTYYQTVKGMVGAVDILQPGGDLIIASQCSEGLGSPEYVQAQRRLVAQGPERFLREILDKSHADVDEWQTQKQLHPMSIGKIQLFSDGLSANDHPLTGVEVVDSIQAAIASSIGRHVGGAVAVIPEGPYVVPFCRSK